jgi:hypothetical protein
MIDLPTTHCGNHRWLAFNGDLLTFGPQRRKPARNVRAPASGFSGQKGTHSIQSILLSLTEHTMQ